MSKEQVINVNESHRMRDTIIGTAVAVTAFVGCSSESNSDESARITIPASTIEEYCDNAPFAADQYEENVGIGPFAPNKASEAEIPNNTDIKDETIKSLGQGNAWGVALYKAADNQYSAAFSSVDLMTEAEEIFNDIRNDKEKFSDACEAVGQQLNQEGQVTDITSTKVLEIVNKYDSEGLTFDVLDPEDDTETLRVIPVLGFRNPNNGVTIGMVLGSDGNESRNGRFIIAKDVGDDTTEIAEDALEQVAPEADGETPAPVDVIVTPEGVEVPVTYVETPDGVVIPVTTDPETGVQTPVDPETGEPTGETVPEGSVPQDTGDSTDGTNPDNGNETGEGCGVNPGDDCDEPSEEPVNPGTTPSNPTNPGPTTTAGPGPTTTVGGPTTTTGGGTTTTTTQPEETTTTTQPEETTTTTQPEETTTTTQPEETTTTTTQPKGTVPTTTTGPGTTAPPWIK